MSTRSSRRSMVVAGAVVAAGVVAGAVAAQLGGSGAPAGLEAAIAKDPLVRVAGIPAQGGRPARGVFVQPTSAGFLCLWDAPSTTSRGRQGGCNPSTDPLAGRELSVSLAYDGGPAARSVTDARLIGLTSSDVDAVQVVMSDGSRRGVRLEDASVAGDAFGAFGYRLEPRDLKNGIGPTAVVALDAGGREIDRQATGFGS